VKMAALPLPDGSAVRWPDRSFTIHGVSYGGWLSCWAALVSGDGVPCRGP
jgi:hypothetical protein